MSSLIRSIDVCISNANLRWISTFYDIGNLWNIRKVYRNECFLTNYLFHKYTGRFQTWYYGTNLIKCLIAWFFALCISYKLPFSGVFSAKLGRSILTFIFTAKYFTKIRTNYSRIRVLDLNGWYWPINQSAVSSKAYYGEQNFISNTTNITEQYKFYLLIKHLLRVILTWHDTEWKITECWLR